MCPPSTENRNQNLPQPTIGAFLDAETESAPLMSMRAQKKPPKTPHAP